MSKLTATRQLSETDLFNLKAMRPDVEAYLREQGWVFAGVSQPDHKRQWAQMDGNKVKRVALESELEDLVIEIVNSPLQQEQPDVDLVAELKHHLATTPKEQLEKEWKELEPWSNIGPTVQEFLYGKQPDVDLEKEIDNYLSCSEDIEECADNERYYVTKSALLSMARYFFIHGSLNARKKE